MTIDNQIKEAFETWSAWQRSNIVDVTDTELVMKGDILSIAINITSKDGTKIKRHDLYIDNLSELNRYRQILAHEQLDKLLLSIENNTRGDLD